MASEDRQSFLWLHDAARDVAYAFRALARTPGFTLVAMLTLAVGIGAVTVIYSVLRNVVLEPFPYSRSDRLVNVVLKDGSGKIIRGPYFSATEFLDYEQQAQAFEDVVGTSRQGVHWENDAGAQRLTIAWMTPNGFAFLGVGPLLGRTFAEPDVAPGAPPVAVMAYRAWVSVFGSDPGVIGRTLMLDGEPRTVIGVMPPRFEWNVADLWVPAAMIRTDDPQSPRGFRAFQAHLKPGVTAREAETQLNVIGTRRAAERPADYPAGFRFEVIPVVDWVVREFRGVLYLLFGAVSLLLVIACCNVANMLLARATTREREIAIRAAIGASRGRIVRQLLVESGMLAMGSLAAGCGLAYAGIAALAGFMPRQGVPWETQIRLDQPVLFFAVLAAAVATLGFGLYPAMQSVRSDLVASAGLGGRTTAGRRQTRMRSGLVVAQVALSIVLLLGAGVLMRTFVKLASVDLGFDPKNVLVVGVAFPPRQNPSADESHRFHRQALQRITTIPGVRSAAVSNYAPPFGGMGSPLQIPGLSLPPEASVSVLFSSEGLPDTMGLPLTKGRQLSEGEVEQARHVALINEALARTYFGGEDPIGRSVRLPRLATLPVPVTDPTFEIIGIVRDTANQGPRERPAPQVLVPFPLRGAGGLGFVVRTSGDPMRALIAVRQQVQAVDRNVALVEPGAFDDLIQRFFYARPRFSLLVLGIFAVCGVVLVAFGVYGVLAYMVSQQTREIAIRMALGGARAHVTRMILRAGLQLVGIGLALGVIASFVTNRLLASQLWNTSPYDPGTLLTVVAVIVTIGLLACWIPARRAVRVEPMVALRQD